jgi:hypothetical protein
MPEIASHRIPTHQATAPTDQHLVLSWEHQSMLYHEWLKSPSHDHPADDRNIVEKASARRQANWK